MFFGFLAATFIADVIDTGLKGSAYLHSFGLEYPIRITASLVLCVIAIITKNRRTQLTLLTLYVLYQISLIVRLRHGVMQDDHIFLLKPAAFDARVPAVLQRRSPAERCWMAPGPRSR